MKALFIEEAHLGRRVWHIFSHPIPSLRGRLELSNNRLCSFNLESFNRYP